MELKKMREMTEVELNTELDKMKKEYFATISEVKAEALDLYKNYAEEERLKLEDYYLDSDNIVMACIKKESDKHKNKRFF